MRDGASPDDELPLWGSAKFLPICVDGERVAETAGCDQAFRHTRQLLRTLRQSPTLSAGIQTSLLLTKWDRVVAASREEAWEQIERELLEELGELGCETRAFRIAARPEKPFNGDDGMADFMRWFLEPPPTPPAPDAAPSPGRSLGSLEEAS